MTISAYDEIQRLHGMEELKALALRLKLAAENRDRLNMKYVPIPHFVFAEAPGSGITTHFHLFARLLDELKLFGFQGRKQVVEQVLGDKIQPIIDAVRRATGYNYHFHGIVGVEIGKHSRTDSQALGKLIDFAEDRQGEILFVFITGLENGEAPKQLVRQLALTLPLEIVRFPKLDNDNLAFYAEDFLKRKNFSLTDDAKPRLIGVIQKLSTVEGFDGLQSLDNMIDLLIYHACVSKEMSDRVIDEAELDAFMNGGYFDQLSVIHSTNRKIGFGGVK